MKDRGETGKIFRKARHNICILENEGEELVAEAFDSLFTNPTLFVKIQLIRKQKRVRLNLRS